MKYHFCNLGGINWSWLLCYEEVEGGARIVFYDRWHNYGDRMAPLWVEKCMELGASKDWREGGCQIIEGEGRVAVALRFAKYEEVEKKDRGSSYCSIGGKYFKQVGYVDLKVVNPLYVFDYSDKAEVEMWVKENYGIC